MVAKVLLEGSLSCLLKRTNEIDTFSNCSIVRRTSRKLLRYELNISKINIPRKNFPIKFAFILKYRINDTPLIGTRYKVM